MHMPEMHTARSAWDLRGVEYPIPVGSVVRALRLTRGFDQVEFAQIFGISQGHLSKIERGQGKLALGSWMRAVNALAVGAPDDFHVREGPYGVDRPLFVLALPEKRLDFPGAVRLLAGEDGLSRAFHEAESALFAAAVFERMCSPEVCVIPVWPDLMRLPTRRPVHVPAPQAGSKRDVLQVRLEELDAATTIARAWLETTKIRAADGRKINSAPDPRAALKEYYIQHISPMSGYPLPREPGDFLVMIDATGKETLWPLMA